MTAEVFPSTRVDGGSSADLARVNQFAAFSPGAQRTRSDRRNPSLHAISARRQGHEKRRSFTGGVLHLPPWA